MTKESKILTVSYGTFSCTLEGFDDPFNTMKAIAEYFRDLAAEDRYFGAEPPQPDAAMLHRVAEREVARLVETRSRNGAVVLNPAKESSGRVTGRARTARDHAPEPALPVAEPALQDAIPGGVAARLARIRQSVSQDATDTPLNEDLLRALSTDGISPADAPEIDGALAADLEELAALDMPPADTAPDAQAGDTLSRFGALTLDPEASEAPAAADASVPAADDPVNLWASEGAEDLSVDMDAKLIAELDAALAVDFAEGLADDPASALESEQQDAPAAFIYDTAEGDVVLDTASDAALEQAPDTEVLDDIAAMADAAGDLSADVLPEDMPLSPETADIASLVDPLPEDMDIEADAVAEPAPAPPVGRGAGKSRRVSSRVVRIHPDDESDAGRNDAGATRVLNPTGGDADVARLLQQADDVMADSESRRRIESLAHLKAAVAATEAERSQTKGETARGEGSAAYEADLARIVLTDPVPTPDTPAEVRPRRKTVSVRPQEPRPGTIRPGMISPTPLVLVSEQRIDRIVQTEPQEPALSPAAFSPAALAPEPVVAPLASPAMAPEQSPIHKGPSVPGIDGVPLVALRTGRLTGAIGVGAASASPILTQNTVALDRIVHAPAAEPDEDDDLDEDLSEADEAGLASFAEQVGVKSMADMLEAAAAYATCIEKRDRFTRPQLMRRLMASAGGKPVSREDGLRSFGTLLRTGRIEKISRGHYVLAEHSPYLTEARRLG